MTTGWLSYVMRVRKRVTLNKSFVKGALVVAKLYWHYTFGHGRRTFSANAPTLAFYPQPAGPWYNIWLTLQNTSIKITKNPFKADFIFVFDDSTQSNVIQNLTCDFKGRLINHRVTDISKSNVSQIFKDIFGYDLEIDPVTHEGTAVEKSDENGTHDGRLIDCPIAQHDIKSGYAYQKFIDSSFSGKTAEDLRVAAVYGKVATVFHKHKDFNKRFGTAYLSTTVKNAEEVFDDTELKLIAQFCDEIGLDFGAIDVMRDKHDGRIYIVDVNKTCMPVLSLPCSEQYRSLSMIAKSLEAHLLE